MASTSAENRTRRAAARRLLVVGGLLLAAMIALSLWARAAIPPGQEVVLHRGLDGEPTRTGEVGVLLWVLPVVTLPMLGVLAATVRAGGNRMWEPPGSDARPERPMAQAWFGIGIVALLASLHAMFLADATGLIESPVVALLVLMGAWSALFGLSLASERSGEAVLQMSVNFPRPASPSARRRLRRTMGFSFLATGAVTAGAALTGTVAVATIALLVGLLASCAAGLAVSGAHAAR